MLLLVTWKKYELSYKNNKKLPKGLAVGALALGSLLPSIVTSSEAGAALAKGVERPPVATVYADTLGNAALSQAILNKENAISKSIANTKPVNFKNTIAYYHGPGSNDFYVYNPLTANVQVGPNHIELIGYIEPKGSGAGPAVVMFEDNPKIVTEIPNPADPSNMKAVNPVIFPSANGAAYDVYNPVNPVNPQNNQEYISIVENQSQPSQIGLQIFAKS